MNVKKRFKPFLLRSWKQLLFEGFDMSETQFRNCGNCVQTLLFVQSGVSKLVRVNEREKTVQTLPFTLLKAAAFWRFWHIRDTISKLLKLCSDITLSFNWPVIFSWYQKWQSYFWYLFWRFPALFLIFSHKYQNKKCFLFGRLTFDNKKCNKTIDCHCKMAKNTFFRVTKRACFEASKKPVFYNFTMTIDRFIEFFIIKR